MDRTDLKILAILKEDASLPVAEIAARVNLSQTPCWRRIQRLEAQGVIVRRVALLKPYSLRFHREGDSPIRLIFFHGSFASYYPTFMRSLMKEPISRTSL